MRLGFPGPRADMPLHISFSGYKSTWDLSGSDPNVSPSTS
ncbi:hypothetical protein LEP1GSC192_1715 [Leptospira sp. B5-022]|nr:hypothetical protein LEP1GSC192_1715 [Leptospira sp. B5-022]